MHGDSLLITITQWIWLRNYYDILHVLQVNEITRTPLNVPKRLMGSDFPQKTSRVEVAVDIECLPFFVP